MPMLPAVLTLAEAKGCDAQLQHAVAAQDKAGEPFVVDASPLVRFDSSALAVLLACRRYCEQRGTPFVVTGLAPRLAELASLYGVAELLVRA